MPSRGLEGGDEVKKGAIPKGGDLWGFFLI
jgi:hypothetical protein